MAGHLKNKYLNNLFLLSILTILLLLLQKLIYSNKTLCLFNNILGIECYGCGTYRGIISLLNIEIINALNYNINVLVILPLLLYICIKKFINYN